MGGMMVALAMVAVRVAGLLVGWLLGVRGAAQLRAERDARTDEFKRAITDLAAAEERARAAEQLREELAELRDERDIARLENIELKTLASAFEARQKELLEAKEAMAGQFAELSAKALGQAQEVILKRADERFRQSEAMRIGQEKGSSEAAKLVNSLRNAPKSRGRGGEQLLKNVLETCGLSEPAEFATEVSVSDEDGG